MSAFEMPSANTTQPQEDIYLSSFNFDFSDVDTYCLKYCPRMEHVYHTKSFKKFLPKLNSTRLRDSETLSKIFLKKDKENKNK